MAEVYNIYVSIKSAGAVVGGRVARRELRGISTQAIKTTSIIRSLGSTMALLGGTLGLTKASLVIAGYERRMSAVKAITGATAEEFAKLTSKSRILGATTIFTATQAAHGLQFLAQAGFSTKESLDAVGASLTLAQVGMVNLDVATDIVAQGVRSFGKDSSYSTQLVDIYAKAVASANTNLVQLGDAIKYAAPLATQFGAGVEETVAAIGKLSDAGLQATLGGTGIRRVMIDLEKQGKAMQEVYKRAGLNADDYRLSLVGLVAALEGLKIAGATTTDLVNIFGVRGGPAAALLVNNITGIKELAVELRNSKGAAEEMGFIMTDNLYGAFKAAASGVSELVLQLGDKGLGKAMTSFFYNMAGALSILNKTSLSFASATRAVDENIDAWENYYTIIKAVSVAVGGFLVLRVGTSALKGLGAIFQSVTKTGKVFTGSMGSSSKAVQKLNKSMGGSTASMRATRASMNDVAISAAVLGSGVVVAAEAFNKMDDSSKRLITRLRQFSIELQGIVGKTNFEAGTLDLDPNDHKAVSRIGNTIGLDYSIAIKKTKNDIAELQTQLDNLNAGVSNIGIRPIINFDNKNNRDKTTKKLNDAKDELQILQANEEKIQNIRGLIQENSPPQEEIKAPPIPSFLVPVEDLTMRAKGLKEQIIALSQEALNSVSPLGKLENASIKGAAAADTWWKTLSIGLKISGKNINSFKDMRNEIDAWALASKEAAKDSSGIISKEDNKRIDEQAEGYNNIISNLTKLGDTFDAVKKNATKLFIEMEKTKVLNESITRFKSIRATIDPVSASIKEQTEAYELNNLMLETFGNAEGESRYSKEDHSLTAKKIAQSYKDAIDPINAVNRGLEFQIKLLDMHPISAARATATKDAIDHLAGQGQLRDDPEVQEVGKKAGQIAAVTAARAKGLEIIREYGSEEDKRRLKIIQLQDLEKEFIPIRKELIEILGDQAKAEELVLRMREEAGLSTQGYERIFSGMEAGIERVRRKAQDLHGTFADITEGALKDLSSTMADVVVDGEGDWERLSRTIQKQIVEWAFQNMISSLLDIGGLMGSLGLGGTGSLGGTFTPGKITREKTPWYAQIIGQVATSFAGNYFGGGGDGYSSDNPHPADTPTGQKIPDHLLGTRGKAQRAAQRGSSLWGNAEGGSYQIPPGGNNDSRMVSLAAKPGELITVYDKENKNNNQRSPTVVNFNFPEGADVDSFRNNESQIESHVKQLVD